MTVYGIRNCNTVKSAMAWLKDNDVEVVFHDYKTHGISATALQSWVRQVGWEPLLNRRGTTWRKLGDKVQSAITTEKAALALMMDKTSVIRRPLIEHEGKVIALGFNEEEYKRIFL